LHKPTAGPSDARARRTAGDAGPHSGIPAPSPSDARPDTGLRRALAATTRTLQLDPRPETAVRRAGAHRVGGGVRPAVRRRFGGPVAGQLALFDLRPSGYRAALTGVGRAFLRQDRSIAFIVGSLVLIAAVTAAIPSSGSAAPLGATDGFGDAVRIPVGMPFAAGDGSGPMEPGEAAGSVDAGIVAGDVGAPVAAQAAAPVGIELPVGEPEPSATDQGAFLSDGTLLKPIAVDTSVPDASDSVQVYRVKPGDTLTGIARQYGVSMKTIWWANNLKSKDRLKPGTKLRIPPDDGLLVKVKEGESLDRIARTYDADPARIQEANGLADDTVFIGQTLFIPKSAGTIASVPTPTPKPRPRVEVNSDPGGGSVNNGGGQTRPVGPVRYAGGRMAWPVVGGGNYLSQYSHYGHPAIDVAGEYGSPVVAAAGGRVIYAGWRSNGGGYQVWIDHGNGLYTTYNHLSGVSVGAGQTVGAGQRIGSLGSSGWATGPHLHFEVWVGYPWSGGSRVNPLAYLR
jgi:murein DD-endopeptidase MepM/ murein hydrolase activator NlpD